MMWWLAGSGHLVGMFAWVPQAILTLAAGAVALVGVASPNRAAMAERLCGVLLAPLAGSTDAGVRPPDGTLEDPVG